MSLPSRTAEDFFDTEYRNYAIYTIENRAIPSLADGFKPAQRKIAFAANKLWKTGNEKPMKVFQLGGQAAALSFFHHGSLDSTIIGMTQDFKNSLPIFQGIGQFGSLRSPEAGAPRYIGVKFNENFRLLYKDFELTTSKFEEGEEIEPQFFLPIIPTVLLNGGSGIAVGFATNILNRHPLDLIDAVIEILKTGETQNPLKPWINGFYGEVKAQPNTGGRSWWFTGITSVKNTLQVEVTEIPPSFTYEKYEAHLDSLVEKGILSSYEDNSSDRIRYLLKFSRAKLQEILADDKLEGLLKMRESMTENITTLDEKGKLKVFSSAQELLYYFVDFRLGYYEKRKSYLMKILSEEIGVLENRVNFITRILSNTLVLNNKPKGELVGLLENEGFSKVDGSYDYLLTMPLYSLTAERHKDLQARLSDKVKERDDLQKRTAQDLYLSDLNDLKKKLSSKPAFQKKAVVAPVSSKAPQTNLVQGWLKEKNVDALDFLLGED
jgi:DNA topoisomerase-2